MVIEVRSMRSRRKETVKSVILGILVLLSLTLSYLIITYQPDYEIFTKRTTQKPVESNKNSLFFHFFYCVPEQYLAFGATIPWIYHGV